MVCDFFPACVVVLVLAQEARMLRTLMRGDYRSSAGATPVRCLFALLLASCWQSIGHNLLWKVSNVLQA